MDDETPALTTLALLVAWASDGATDWAGFAAEAFFADGLITEGQKDAIVGAAAKSNCGKK